VTDADRKPVLDLYARVSRKGDARRRSMEGQIAASRRRAEALGAQVGEVFDKDDGRSAWNPRVKRHDWDRLMQRLESGESDGVVVFDLARFSRRPIEGERLIEAAERGMVVADSEAEYDLTTGVGRKTFRDAIAAAAFYSDEISARTKRGKQEKAMLGEPNHSRRPYGFERDGLTIREEEAQHLRDISARFVRGDSMESIVAHLNGSGVKTSLGRHWTAATLKHLLKRPRNMGVIEYRGAEVARIPGDPIISSEDFERTQAIFAARRPGRPVSDKYLCSGIARCGKCGATLKGRPRKGVGPDSEPKREYLCQQQQGRGGCWGIVVDGGSLDGWVRDFVIARLSDERDAPRIGAAQAKVRAAADRSQQIAADIAQAEELAEQLSDRLGRGELTLARYDAAVAPLDRRIAALRAEAQALAPQLAGVMTVLTREEATAMWQGATSAERRTMLLQALAGRQLVVKPAEAGKPREFDPERVTVASR
jgi:DNA invertase Pin-like site-specific DNA recombinase